MSVNEKTYYGDGDKEKNDFNSVAKHLRPRQKSCKADE